MVHTVHHAQVKEIKQASQLSKLDTLSKWSTHSELASSHIGDPAEPSTSGVVMRTKIPAQRPEYRSSITFEGSSDEDESSVSVTTGRLSLTLSHSSDKDGAMDVTSALVNKEHIETQIAASRARVSSSKSGSSVVQLRTSGNYILTLLCTLWILKMLTLVHVNKLFWSIRKPLGIKLMESVPQLIRLAFNI